MAKVNPPPHLKIPKDFFEKKDKRTYFQQIEFILFQLWTKTGGGADTVETGNEFNPLTAARLTSLEQRIGSGDALTSDETGFTVDSTALTVDQVEA